MQKRKRIVAVCPGRGSYAQNELGYLARYGAHHRDFIEQVDGWRRERDEISVSEMDSAEKYSVRLHTPGENASILIYTCALVDYMSLDQEKCEVVAVTGNSLGWYLTLAAAGALNSEAAFKIVNTMGSMMKDGVLGGQLIYPLVDEEWHLDPERVELVQASIKKVREEKGEEIYESIFLGGFLVIGGSDKGLRELTKILPPLEEKYPMRLVNHAAFHTPLLAEVSEKAKQILPEELFQAPRVPMIDGRGKIWQPYSTDVRELREYTLGHQVHKAYDYTAAIEVAIKEFAPDAVVLLGPGSSLGGATGQVLVKNSWHGITNKGAFSELQKKNPFLIAMGREDQRHLVV